MVSMACLKGHKNKKGQYYYAAADICLTYFCSSRSFSAHSSQYFLLDRVFVTIFLRGKKDGRGISLQTFSAVFSAFRALFLKKKFARRQTINSCFPSLKKKFLFFNHIQCLKNTTILVFHGVVVLCCYGVSKNYSFFPFVKKYQWGHTC